MAATFGGDFTLRSEPLLTEDELARLKEFAKIFRQVQYYKLLVWDGDTLVGWSIGNQASDDTYYMRNSGVIPAYRNRGIYSEILRLVLEFIAKTGAQIVSSRHRIDNNAILIAKLKAGFFVTGMEVSDKFGTMLNLSFYFSPKREKLLAMRAGSIPPPPGYESLLDR